MSEGFKFKRRISGYVDIRHAFHTVPCPVGQLIVLMSNKFKFKEIAWSKRIGTVTALFRNVLISDSGMSDTFSKYVAREERF